MLNIKTQSALSNVRNDFKNLEEVEYTCPLSDVSVRHIDSGKRRRLPAYVNAQAHTIPVTIAAWHWVLHWISDKAESQITAIRSNGDEIFFIITDITENSAIESLKNAVCEQFFYGMDNTDKISQGVSDTAYEALDYHTINLFDNNDCHRRAEVEIIFADDQCFIDCAASCFSENYHQYLVQLWQNAVKLMQNSAPQLLSQVPLYNWNALDYQNMGLVGERTAVEGNLIDLFLSAVQKTPGKIAIIDGENTLSYAKVNELSSAWAEAMKQKGVNKGESVGLAFESKYPMVVAQLAVLKLGAIFVPIDANHPQSRLQSILEDTSLRVILTEEDNESDFLTKLTPEDYPELSCLIIERLATQATKDFTQSPAATNDTAYIIFTSGSTGKPKGVKVSHGNLINFIQFMKKYVGPDDVSSQFAPFTFDASVAEIHAGVLNGGTLIMLSRELIENPESLQSHLTEHKVTFSAFPPSYAKHLQPEKLPHQKTLLTAGSAPDHAFIRQWQPHLTYINAYGPTETTILSTLWEADHVVDVDKPIVMGGPISNTQIKLVNQFDHMIPPGFIGELIIGGAGVTQGYINRDEVTREKYFTEDHNNWYRSGDLVSQDHQGRLVFYGRADNQVKLRGHRLELGEVETAFKSIQAITNAAALVTTKSLTAQLFVFCVGQKIEELDLRQHMEGLLPQWAMPNRIYWLDEMPLTVNGKTDYKSLESKIPVGKNDDCDVKASMNPLEKSVAEIWENVLHVPQVGPEDNFIHLGGDSLTALVIASSLKKMGFVINSSLVLTQPILEEFVNDLVDYQVSDDVLCLTDHYEPVEGQGPLSAIQQWFVNLPLIEPNQFCQSLVFDCNERLDLSRFEKAFNELCHYHDILRSGFLYKNETINGLIINNIEEVYVKVNEMSLDHNDLETATKQCLADQTQNINISQGELFNVSVLQMQTSSRVIWVMHHTLVDTISHSILLGDLYQLYQEQKTYQETLPEKTLSYLEWAKKQQKHIEINEAQIFDQWQPILNNGRNAQLTHIIGCQPSNGVLREKTLAVSNSISDQLTSDTVLNCYHQTTEELVLSAAALALSETFGKSQFIMDIEWHGRDEEFAGLQGVSRTVGWFTSVHPHLFTINNQDSLEGLLIDIKETRAQVNHKGRDYYLLKYFSQQDTTINCFKQYQGADVLFNFSGVVQRKNANWQTVPVSAIEMGSEGEYLPYNLSIETELRDGELLIHAFYNASVLEESVIDQFLLMMQKSCAKIVEHCSHAENNSWTASDFPLLNLSQSELNTLPKNITAAYPLTDMQKTMYNHMKKYQVWMYYDFPRAFDRDAFERSCEKIVMRHDSLRTCIQPLKQEAIQVVLKDWRPKITIHSTTENLSDKAEAFIELSRGQNINVVGAPSISIDVMHNDSDRFMVVLSIHHLNHDGWSINLLLEALFNEYCYQLNETSTGASSPLNTLEAVVAEQQRISEDHAAKQYWIDRPWNGDFCRLSSQDHSMTQQEMKLVTAEIDENTVKMIKKLAQSSGVTINSVWMAAYAYALRYIGGMNQVRFGVLQSGRAESIEGVDTITGCCVNTLPMVLNIDMGQSLNDILMMVNQSLSEMRTMSLFPLSLIQSLTKEVAGTELFETLFNIESDNYAKSQAKEKPLLVGGYEATNAALNFGVIEQQGEFGLRLGYNPNLFDDFIVKQIIDVYHSCLQQFILDKEACWNAPKNLYGQRSQTLLSQWNETKTPYPNDDIWHLFEQQSSEHPNKEALWQKLTNTSFSYSYQHLKKKAEKLAYRIDKQLSTSKPESTIVGIMSERSAELIIAILAIIRLGKAYLPLDPKYPVERIAHMLHDTDCSLVLLQDAEMQPILPDGSFDTLIINEVIDNDELDSEEMDLLPLGNVPSINRPQEQLAYVMYTSGSTGKPKGVLVQQKSVVRLVKNCDYAPLADSDQVLLTGAPVFDATTYEIWGSLLNGGCLNIVEENVLLNTEQLSDVLKHRNISTMWLTSPLFNQHVMQKPAMFSTVKQLLVGGDALSVEHIKLAKQSSPELCIINGYGPTENTTFSVCYRIEPNDKIDTMTNIPIGRPIQNSTAHVVNDAGQLLPVGFSGELWVGGDGVAQGYLNHIELTQEKFVQDDFNKQNNTKLYKTGDRVRWTETGVIEFIGRVDDQVKIRGYRVEPGEIENHLTKHPSVEEARVLVKQDEKGSKQLVAYLALGDEYNGVNGFEFDAELKRYASQNLPEYMVPMAFVLLEKMPLNQNGKIARNELPEPNFCQELNEISLACSETEQALLNIMSDILGYPCRNIEADFFWLGGSSLDAVKFIAEISQQFTVDINVDVIFNAKNLRELASFIDSEVKSLTTLGDIDIEDLSDEELNQYLEQLS